MDDPKTNELVLSRQACWRHYLRGWFAIDLLGSVPSESIKLAVGFFADEGILQVGFLYSSSRIGR